MSHPTDILDGEGASQQQQQQEDPAAMDVDPSAAGEGGRVEIETNGEAGPSALSYSPIFTLMGHSRAVSSLAFSPDGTLLASASSDKTIRIWSLRGGQLLQTLKGHRGGVSDIAWSPCGRYVASASDDKTVVVWNVKSGYIVRQLIGHTSYVFCVAYSPQSNLIVSGSFDETVRLWDVRKGICHRKISAHSEAVTDVDFNLDGTLIASCSYDGLIRLWDVPTGLCLATLPHPTSSPTTSIRFSPSSSHLLASSLDSTLRLWDVVKGKIVKTYKPDGESTGGKVFQNEKFAIKSNFVLRRKRPEISKLGDEDASLGSTTTTTSNDTKTLSPPPSPSSTDLHVISGSEDCKVYTWEVQSRSVPTSGGVLSGHHRDVVTAVAVHPTRAILASAAADHDTTIRVSKKIRWRRDCEL